MKASHLQRLRDWWRDLDAIEILLLALLAVIGLPLAVLCTVVLWATLLDVFLPHETITLRADAWRCTASHVEHGHVTVMVGKVPVTTPRTSTVCDQYQRRRRIEE